MSRAAVPGRAATGRITAGMAAVTAARRDRRRDRWIKRLPHGIKGYICCRHQERIPVLVYRPGTVRVHGPAGKHITGFGEISCIPKDNHGIARLIGFRSGRDRAAFSPVSIIHHRVGDGRDGFPQRV